MVESGSSENFIDEFPDAISMFDDFKSDARFNWNQNAWPLNDMLPFGKTLVEKENVDP